MYPHDIENRCTFPTVCCCRTTTSEEEVRRHRQPIALILTLSRQSDAQGGTLSAIKKVLVECLIDNDIVTSDCHDWCVKGLELMHDDDLIEGEGYYGASEYLLNLG